MDKRTTKSLKTMLRPIIRFSIKRSVVLQEIIEIIKQLLVEEANIVLDQLGESSNTSKVCVMTGVHRKDIPRLSQDSAEQKRPLTVVRRVMEQWQQNPDFLTKSGKARVLTADGPESEFFRMVQSVSRDLNPATVLNELERTAMLKRTRNGVRLTSRVYNPDPESLEGYELLASDTADLITAVDENISTSLRIPNLHIKTEYDNIDSFSIPEIRQWLYNEGSSFHQRARNYLSQFDKDINKNITNTGGARVVIGSFSLTSQDQENVK